MAGGVSEGSALWEPSEGVVADARVTRFVHWLWERGVRTESYDELWRWSVTEVDAFWDAIWSYFGVVGERGDGPVRTGGPMPVDGLKWFPGATVNYAANALRRAEETPEETAVIFRSEAGGHRVLSYRSWRCTWRRSARGWPIWASARATGSPPMSRTFRKR